MKKLAINSFLAVTAMAWMGPAAQSQTGAQPWRDAGARTGISIAQAPTASGSDQDKEGAGLLYSTQDRASLSAWLRQRVVTARPVRPGLQRGDRLDALHPGHVAMLPGEISRALSHTGGLTMDLAIDDQVVRVMRNSRRVIDTVSA